MERIESPDPFAGGGLFHSAARQVQCELRLQSRICLLQLPRSGFDARIFSEMISSALVEFAQPLLHSHRSIGEFHSHGPDAFNQHKPGNPGGNRSAKKKRDRAAHRMADQANRIAVACANKCIEIADVIGEMIIAAGADPAAFAMAAAIRRYDPERNRRFLLKACDERIPAVRLIEKTVDENDGSAGRRIAPFEIVEAQSLYIEKFIARDAHAVFLRKGDSRKSLFASDHVNAAIRLTLRS